MLWQISECAFCWMKKLDWRLGRGLLGHEVETVQRLGWAGPACRYNPADAKNLADSALHRKRNGDCN